MWEKSIPTPLNVAFVTIKQRVMKTLKYTCSHVKSTNVTSVIIKKEAILQLRNTQRKKHGSSDHNKLHHMKMNRNNPNEVCEKGYYVDEI